jgi:hypothetical protein
MNLRSLFVVLGFCFAATSFASTQKSLCNQIGQDELRCLQVSQLCAWDKEDQRCEAITETRCTQYDQNPFACNNAIGCQFDDEDQRCEEIGDEGLPVPPSELKGCYFTDGDYVPHGYQVVDADGDWLTCVDGEWTY